MEERERKSEGWRRSGREEEEGEERKEEKKLTELGGLLES